jgi:hypothetical protein
VSSEQSVRYTAVDRLALRLKSHGPSSQRPTPININPNMPTPTPTPIPIFSPVGMPSEPSLASVAVGEDDADPDVGVLEVGVSMPCSRCVEDELELADVELTPSCSSDSRSEVGSSTLVLGVKKLVLAAVAHSYTVIV